MCQSTFVNRTPSAEDCVLFLQRATAVTLAGRKPWKAELDYSSSDASGGFVPYASEPEACVHACDMRPGVREAFCEFIDAFRRMAPDVGRLMSWNTLTMRDRKKDGFMSMRAALDILARANGDEDHAESRAPGG